MLTVSPYSENINFRLPLPNGDWRISHRGSMEKLIVIWNLLPFHEVPAIGASVGEFVKPPIYFRQLISLVVYNPVGV